MKKCSLRIAFALLLVSVAILPAFCGWDAFKSSSPDSSVGSLTLEMTEKSEPITTEPQTTSSEEAVTEEKTIEEHLEKSSESSKNYDEALTATKEAVEATQEVVTEPPEKVAEVAELAEKVDNLIASKAVLDEDQELLESIVKKQTKELEKAERKLSGINWGLGLSLGYRPMLAFSPGLTVQMRAGDWTFRTDLIYEVDIQKTRDEMLNPRNLEVRIGVIYEF